MAKFKTWIKNTFVTGNKLNLKAIVVIPLIVFLLAGISVKWFVFKSIETADLVVLVPPIIGLLWKKKSEL